MYVNCNYNIATTLYTLETWFVSARPYKIVSPLHTDYHHHNFLSLTF